MSFEFIFYSLLITHYSLLIPGGGPLGPVAEGGPVGPRNPDSEELFVACGVKRKYSPNKIIKIII